MPTLLQINTVINSGSTGRIAEQLGELVMANGWNSYIAFGRSPRPSASRTIRVGGRCAVYAHGLLTRFFDAHGFGSRFATKKLIKQIEKIKPDVIHLHNIHGYYLNVDILFAYLRKRAIPVVWTLHDCWPFTGHCSHYTAVNCQKWRQGCDRCPQKNLYPKSFLDNSRMNWTRKKSAFGKVKNLTLVTPSVWLAEQVKESFLQDYPIKTIPNGIDLNVFKPSAVYPAKARDLEGKKIILGVASVWNDRKGLSDFLHLSRMLRDDEAIVLVGLSHKRIRAGLPERITAVERTESQAELAQWYSAASVFFNPTYEDTFPTTNIESLACGTPVVTYRSGGSPEIVDSETGFVVAPGSVAEALSCIRKIERAGKSYYSARCSRRANTLYDRDKNFRKYLEIYNGSVQDSNTMRRVE